MGYSLQLYKIVPVDEIGRLEPFRTVPVDHIGRLEPFIKQSRHVWITCFMDNIKIMRVTD